MNYHLLYKIIADYNIEKLLESFLTSWLIVKFILSYHPPQRGMSPASGFLLWPVYLRNAALHKNAYGKRWFRRIWPLLFALFVCLIPFILLLLMNNISVTTLLGLSQKKVKSFQQNILNLSEKYGFEWIFTACDSYSFFLYTFIYYLFGAVVTFAFFEHGCVHASHPEMLPFLQYSMTLVSCVCSLQLSKYSNLSGMHAIAAEYLIQHTSTVRLFVSTLIILQLCYLIIEILPSLFRSIFNLTLPKLRWPGRNSARSLLSEAEYIEEAETMTRNELASLRHYLSSLSNREVWQYVLKLREPHRIANLVLSDEDDNYHLSESEVLNHLANSRPRLPADIEQEQEDELVARRLEAELFTNHCDDVRLGTSAEAMETEESNSSYGFGRFIPTLK